MTNATERQTQNAVPVFLDLAQDDDIKTPTQSRGHLRRKLVEFTPPMNLQRSVKFDRNAAIALDDILEPGAEA